MHLSRRLALPGGAPPHDRLGRRLGLAVAAVVASGLFMAWWLHWFDLVDLEVYRAGALALLHGRDIYQARPPGSNLPFTYPPLAALVFVPLGVLPDVVARVAISLASASALVVATLAALRLAGPDWPRRSRWTVALAVLAATPLFEPLRDTFRLGQINLVLMAMVMTDLASVATAPDTAQRRDAQRTPRWSGVLVGLATAIKLTPAVFIVFLLVTRRTRQAAVAATTAATATLVAFAVMPSASVHYWTRLVFDIKRIGNPGNVWNQSIRGVLARLTGSADQAHLVWLAAAVVALVAGLVLAVRYHHAGDELLAVGIAALTGLLVSPISWNHHWVWALPAAVGLWRRAGLHRRVGAIGAATAWTAVFAVASMSWWTFTGRDDYRLGGIQNIEAACYVLAGLTLFALVAWWQSPRLHPVE
jgi:alpha-1,2-mannosyltransferase